MREITTHQTNEANKQLRITADDRNPEHDNASHFYEISHWRKDLEQEESHEICFQDGPIAEVGVNGLTNEVLLAIVIDRLEGFQSSKWACIDNEVALRHTYAALAALEARTRAREARGVEGTHKL